MPLSRFDPHQLKGESTQKIVLQCQSGSRSVKAAQKMFEAGFSQVMHLQGGLPTWKAAGYPTQVNGLHDLSHGRGYWRAEPRYLPLVSARYGHTQNRLGLPRH